MRLALAVIFAMLLGPASGVAQNRNVAEWRISKIQFSVLKKIEGTFIDKLNNRSVVARTAEKGSIVEVRAILSYPIAPPPAIPDISGDGVLITGGMSKSNFAARLPLPIIRLIGATEQGGKKSTWVFDPMAVGFDTPNGCVSYFFLDSMGGGGSSLSSNGESIGFDIVRGETRVSMGSFVPLCFAIPAPELPQEMLLEFAGSKFSSDGRSEVAILGPNSATPASDGGVFPVGGPNGASTPICTVQPEPNYSDDARKAHINGTVVIDVVIQKDGRIDVVRVARSVGYGLDEEAKKVLMRWKCDPGKVNGQPVATRMPIVFDFLLYK